MKILVKEVRSRIIEVPTNDFNEGKKKVKKILNEHPLDDSDSEGLQFFSSLFDCLLM